MYKLCQNRGILPDTDTYSWVQDHKLRNLLGPDSHQAEGHRPGWAWSELDGNDPSMLGGHPRALQIIMWDY